VFLSGQRKSAVIDEDSRSGICIAKIGELAVANFFLKAASGLGAGKMQARL